MKKPEQKRYEALYRKHLNALKRQGKSDSTIGRYGHAVRRIAKFFDRCPDKLTLEELKEYFLSLVNNYSWSTVKVDRNGLQFFYKHVLDRQWKWVDIIKPPITRHLPDILTHQEIARIIRTASKPRYQAYIITVYTMGLRLGEALNLEIGDIDAGSRRIHIRNAKGYKDRYVKLPDYTLSVLREYWCLHHNPRFIFPAGKTQAQRQQSTQAMDRGGVQKAVKVIVSSAGIHKSISVHSFRHCYGAHLVEEGLNLRAIQNELGHLSLKTTALYTQLTDTTQQNTHCYINRMVNRFLLALKNDKGVSDATFSNR